MKTAMNEKTSGRLQEEFDANIGARNILADRLVEKWSHKKGLKLNEGQMDDLYNSNASKARNLAIVLENEERHLQTLTETQISTAFNSTPQTVVKVIRLGYPNSIRGDVFNEFAMTTMKDTLYKIETIVDRTKRGATTGDVTYESDAERYASEIEEYSVTTSATGSYSGTVDTYPIRAYTVTIYVNSGSVGTDDGNGTISGDDLTSGTIDYTTGAFTLEFTDDLTADDTLMIVYSHNSEYSDLYDETGSVNVQLVGYDFRAHPFPLSFMWSKNAEMQMQSALNVNMEDVLIGAGADELKKALDLQAITMANRASNWTDAITFDTDWSTSGADSDWAHTQSVTKSLRNASQQTYDELMRGGKATSYLAGAGACTYLTNHASFKYDDKMDSVGAYKMGTLQGIPVYQVPSNQLDSADILCVYKNNRDDANDAALTIGTYVPLFKTPTVTLNDFTTQQGMSFFGDMKCQEAKYITKVTLENL